MSRRFARRHGAGRPAPGRAATRPDPRRNGRQASSHGPSDFPADVSETLPEPLTPIAPGVMPPFMAEPPTAPAMGAPTQADRLGSSSAEAPGLAAPETSAVTAGPQGSDAVAVGPADVHPSVVGHAVPQPSPAGPPPAAGHLAEDPDAAGRGCTVAQLRRFIKSRPYVPMHELRRRFELNGASDDVTPIATQEGTVFLGLPEREARLIADLVGQGDVGLELCRDPRVPIVVGVYAMRPIARQ
jgi:hypothetical protein